MTTTEHTSSSKLTKTPFLARKVFKHLTIKLVITTWMLLILLVGIFIFLNLPGPNFFANIILTAFVSTFLTGPIMILLMGHENSERAKNLQKLEDKQEKVWLDFHGTSMGQKKPKNPKRKTPLLARKALKNINFKMSIFVITVLAITIAIIAFPLSVGHPQYVNVSPYWLFIYLLALSFIPSSILYIIPVSFVLCFRPNVQKKFTDLQDKQNKVWLDFYGTPMNEKTVHVPSTTTTPSEVKVESVETVTFNVLGLPKDIQITVESLQNKIRVLKESSYIQNDVEKLHSLEQIESDYVPKTVDLFNNLYDSRKQADSKETLSFKNTLDSLDKKLQTYLDEVDNAKVKEFNAQLSFVESVI